MGTRHVTPYGEQMTKKFTTDLVENGFTIVSGLAYGVDTIAHWAAIDAGGKTIAVLGCGIDIIASAGNTDLYWDIVRGHGAVVSELPDRGAHAEKKFVTRNRIISGLSLGVVVIEGTEKAAHS